jgi:cell division protein FtsB
MIAYFAGHAMKGRHGLEARRALQARETVLSKELESLEAVRSRLERDVALMSPDQPDPDMLDEQARRVLGFARQGERILIEGR